MTLKTIDISRIDRDPNQPRQHFDEVKLGELAASMATLGQLQAVTVRYDRATRRYTIVSGERRWRAAQQAGLNELHAMVIDVAEEDVLPRAVAENLGRADMTPMEEAAAFARLRDAGHDTTTISTWSGKSTDYVSCRLDLLTLIAPAREALNRGHLPVGTAWYVAKLAPASQQRFLVKWVRGDFHTARDAEAFAQACRNAEAAKSGEGDQQGSLLDVGVLTDEERQQFETRRRRVTSKIDRLAAAGEILQELAGADPVELAQLLAGLPGGVAAYQARVDHIKAAAAKTSAVLRKAKAVAAAAEVEISDDLSAGA